MQITLDNWPEIRERLIEDGPAQIKIIRSDDGSIALYSAGNTYLLSPKMIAEFMATGEIALGVRVDPLCDVNDLT